MYYAIEFLTLEGFFMILCLTLPFPPSVNGYWGFQGSRRFLTDKAKAFKVETLVAFKQSRHTGFGDARLSVSIDLHAKDKRARDIDNVVKSLLDALCQARVFTDDSQVDILFVRRAPNEKGGKCVVRIAEINACA